MKTTFEVMRLRAKMQVDGGYGAMSAEGHGESSGSWAGSNK